MCPYFIIILCLMPFGLRAQRSAIIRQGRWVSTELNSLVFRNGQVLDAVLEGTPEHSNYVFKGDTLVLVKNYYSSVDDFAFERSDSAKFLIKTATARQLILVPANANARNLARRREYRFDNLPYLPAENIRFKALTLSYATSDPAHWQMDIDQRGNVTFMGALTPQIKAGNYIAKLGPAQLDTLQGLLQHSLLPRLNAWRQNVALTDVPELKLELTTTDGQVYRLQSRLIPASVEPLLQFVLSLPKRLSWVQQPTSR